MILPGVLPGMVARKEILQDVGRIIDEHPDMAVADILTIIGYEKGLTPTKAREYYRDVINYRRLVENKDSGIRPAKIIRLGNHTKEVPINDSRNMADNETGETSD